MPEKSLSIFCISRTWDICPPCGSICVTFDVPATEGWNGANDRFAGELVIAKPSPAEDFVVSDGVLVSYTGYSSHVIIEIKGDAFAHNASLVSVKVSHGVKTIGFGAFNNCKNLQNAILPESFKSRPLASSIWRFKTTALSSAALWRSSALQPSLTCAD